MALVLDGTNGVSGVDGTASNPAIEGTDSNTGIFYPAADTVAIGTGGTERLRVDSAGNAGLGVTPSAWVTGGRALDIGTRGALVDWSATQQTDIWSNGYYNGTNSIYKTNGNASIYRQASGQHQWYNAPSGTAGNAITFTQAMTLDASGNLGVGTTSPNSRLDVTGTSPIISVTPAAQNQNTAIDLRVLNAGTYGAARIAATNASTYDSNLLFYTNTSTSTTLVERARITSGGDLLVGTTTNADAVLANFKKSNSGANIIKVENSSTTGNVYAAYFHLSGQSPNNTNSQFLYCADSTAERATIRSNGGLANYSANNVNLASDQRLKKDISPLATTWDKVKQIEVVNFRYKDCNEGDPLLYGVIAQQVQPIVPELVVVTQEAKEAIEAKEAVLDDGGNVVEQAVEAKEATPEYFGIREQPMYWLAIKALQEAMTRIEQLEAKVAALENA